MKTYIPYHIHDDRSNCSGFYDSVTTFESYVKLAKEQNIPAISVSNHGNIYDWIKNKQICDKEGIKYIHGIEAYMCLNADDKGLYHIGLYARNFDGVKELNELISSSTLKDGHFYKKPRVFLSEIMNTSNNIIITTACIANIIWQLRDYNQSLDFVKFLSSIKHRCFLEVQYHNHKDQIQLNKLLHKYSIEYDIPLIAGTDTHSANEYDAKCRDILQKSNGSNYADEDSFDLTWKTYDELVEAFKNQNTLPEDVYMKAISNTHVFADMVESFDLDYSFKYPNLYDNPTETFMALVDRQFTKFINQGIIFDNEEYNNRLIEEVNAIKKQGMESFMIFMYELVTYCRDNNIIYGRCRGSVGGSLVAYLLDIIDLNPIIDKTIFSRFCNEDRISLADIDMDFAPEDRIKVYEYIIKRFSTRKTSYISQFGTIKAKGTIDIIARGLGMNDLEEITEIKESFLDINLDYEKIINESINLEEYKLKNDIDNHEEFLRIIDDDLISSDLIVLYKKYKHLKEKYSNLFYYFDGLKGTIISKGNHPAGMIGSPIDLVSNIGVWYQKGDKNFPVAVCSMEQIDSLNFCKFDILGLKYMGLIKDIYLAIGKKYPRSHEVDWNDKNVYQEMLVSKVGFFQFEGNYAFDMIKEFKPKSIQDVNIMIAAIRPSGKTYRDKLLKKEFHKNASEEIDKLFKENYGFIIYQEDTIKFLQLFCGFSGGEADTVRRAIGKKKDKDIQKALPKIIEGYKNTCKKSTEIAKKEIAEFLQSLKDSARYQFGLNHSDGYSKNAYTGIMLRHYYPVNFVTAYLNRADNSEDYYNGAELARIKNIKIHNIEFKKSFAKYRHENNSIYKGLGSVKFLGNEETIDKQLVEVYKREYTNFVDVLYSMNSSGFSKKHILILIKLNYFKVFGNPNYLEQIFNLYLKYNGRKQFNKKDLSKFETMCVIKFSNKITDKIFKKINIRDMLVYMVENYMKVPSYSYLDLIKNEYIYYSYVHSKLDVKNENIVIILDIEIKNIIKVKVYHIQSGIQKVYIINKFRYYKHQNYGNIAMIPRFEVFDLIEIKESVKNDYGILIISFVRI